MGEACQLSIENWILARLIQSAAKIPAIRRRVFDGSLYRLA